MGMDYALPCKRRTKKDLKMKRKFRVYKKGGRFRSMNIEDSEESEENKKDKKKE